MLLSSILAAKTGYTSKTIGDETILIPISNNVADMGAILNLNEVGTFIWQQINENSTMQSLLQDIINEFEVDSVVAEKDLRDFLETLHDFMSTKK